MSRIALILFLIANLLICPVRCHGGVAGILGADSLLASSCFGGCCGSQAAPTCPSQSSLRVDDSKGDDSKGGNRESVDSRKSQFPEKCGCHNCACQGALITPTFQAAEASLVLALLVSSFPRSIRPVGAGACPLLSDLPVPGSLRPTGRFQCICFQSWQI